MASPQVTSVGTPTLVRATSGSITGSWGTGQNRTAGNNLAALVTAGGSTASAAAISTPSGWTQAGVLGNVATTANAWVAVYVKVAAGSDAAPAFTATLSGTVAMTCTLLELEAGCASLGADFIIDVSGVYQSGGAASTVSAMAPTISPETVSFAGEYAVAIFCQEAAAATNTWNGAGGSWSNLVNDGATSSVLHTAIDVQTNPAAGSTLSETGHWTTDTTAFGAAVIVSFAPLPGGVELWANEATTTISSGGTGAPASGTPELWTAASWSSFPAASQTTAPRTKFHVSDPALPTEIIEVVNTTTGLVIRGAEGSTPVAHSGGFAVNNVISQGALASLLQPHGPQQWSNIRTVTTSGSVSATADTVVLVDATAGAVTLTLPDAFTCQGLLLVVKQIDTSGNSVITTPVTGQFIDGFSAFTISANFQALFFVSDGGNWRVISALGTTTNNELDDGSGDMFINGVIHEGAGTNTSATAAASTPTISTGTAVQINTTQDVMLYCNIKTTSTFSLAIGPTSTPATTVVTSASFTAPHLIGGIRIPAGWFVKSTFTSGDVTWTAVTC